MLTEVKQALRITSESLDSDISLNIDSALLDLSRVGVDVENPTPLHTQAVILYCKFLMNYNNEGERYMMAYERLRDAMALCDRYNGTIVPNGGDSNE